MVSNVRNISVEKVSPTVTAHPANAPKRASNMSSASADTVGVGGTASVAMIGEAAPATGANPFAALLASTANVPAAELRLVADADATSESCEPSLAVLGLLAEVESRTTPRDAWGATKVRNGYMQVTYDAQEERAATIGMDRDASEAIAKQIIHAQEWHGAVGGYFKGGDVNAFVQQVLRECYLLGMTDLQLYGDRLKALNELKKKIREEADRARKVKSEWATAAKADASWVSGTAYETIKVDSAQVALVPDVEVAISESEPVAADASIDAADPFFASSSALPLTTQSELEGLKGYSPDDLRENKTGAIETYVAGMNAYDIEHYLVPLLNTLNRGEHAGTIVQILEKLDPRQLLVVASFGFVDGSGFIEDLKPDEAERLRTAQRNATLTLFGDAVGTELFGKSVTELEARSLLAKLVGPSPADLVVKRRMGERDLSGLQRRIGAQTAEATMRVKTIDTVAEMEDYLKYLEEQMNSVGDDAQLANIDLQNCLQKQQQTLQMMSNISKVLHDVTMAIIRNMNS